MHFDSQKQYEQKSSHLATLIARGKSTMSKLNIWKNGVDNFCWAHAIDKFIHLNGPSLGAMHNLDFCSYLNHNGIRN